MLPASFPLGRICKCRVVVVVLLALPDAALAVESEVDVTRGNIAALVGGLSSDDYDEREAASEALVQAGRDALPWLETAAADPHLEKRLRAERIIAIIAERAYDHSIAAFEADVDGSQNTTLPGFERASLRIGTSSKSRRLFSKLYRAEPRIFETYDDDPHKTAERFISRTQVHTQMFRGPNSWRRIRYAQTPDRTANAMALLLVGSDDRLELPDQTINDFNTFLRTTLPYKQFHDLAHNHLLKTWLGKWIVRRSEQPSLEYANMHLGLSYQIPETLEVAARILGQEDRETVSYRPLAMICVGRFGTEEDMPLLVELLSDTTRVYAGQSKIANNLQIPFEVQVRDIALAMLLHLSGQDLKEYGYENPRTHPMQLYHQNSLFFASDEARAAAFTKWRDFQAAKAAANGSPDDRDE